jgi:hypothetical protein
MPIYSKEILIDPKGKINKDADLRAIPVGDLVDALNCRWGVKNRGNVFACENIIGTKNLPFILPSGVNTVIGGCEDPERNSWIAIYHNSNNGHSIIRINTITENIDPIVYQESIFNFSKNYPIGCARVLSTGRTGEGILIFVEKHNSPRYLNIERLRKYTYETKNEGIGYWIISQDFIVQ